MSHPPPSSSAGLRTGLLTWILFADTRSTALVRLQRCLAAMTTRGLRFGLNTWAEYAGEAKQATESLARSCGAFANAGLRQGWLSWAEHVAELKRAGERMRAAFDATPSSPALGSIHLHPFPPPASRDQAT